MKVSIRTKAITGNRRSIYLDFYPAITNPETGKLTRREFLGLHLYDKAKTPIDKQHNKETLQLAENIKATRQLDIQNNKFGFLTAKKYDTDFIEYFKAECEKRTGKNHLNWLCAVTYLEKYTHGNLKFKDITVNFCNDYRDYLISAKAKNKRPIAQNTAELYFTKFRATVRKAFESGLLETSVSDKVKNIKKAETQRNFVSLDELNSLVKAECKMPVLKTAALFSALTGLRFCDIDKLIWGEVNYNKQNGCYIQFRQKKTKGVEMLPISEQAFSLLGERKENDSKVFEGLYYSSYTNIVLKQWLLKAGITKNITFHSFRHTFATLQLSKGTDIYTVSKMLGHRELKTTQIYAKIIDQTKRDAANKIILDL
jgi:integrase